MKKKFFAEIFGKHGLWTAAVTGWIIGAYRLGAGDESGAIRSVCVTLIWLVPLAKIYIREFFDDNR